MVYLPLHEAWTILGKNANGILASVSRLKREERPRALQTLVEEARKITKMLLAKNHPDRGGNHEIFCRIQLAFDSIVFHTKEFENKAIEFARRVEEINARRPIFIEVKKG